MDWIDITFIGVLAATLTAALVFVGNILFTGMFPHKVTALKIINQKVQVFHSRARVSKDKKTWRLWNVKIAKFIPTPIEQAIEIDEKGKMSVTCYTDSLGEVTQWVVFDDKSEGTTKVIESAEREVYLDEIRRDAKIGQKTLMEHIFNFLPMLVLAGVIVLAMFTVPDIYKEHMAVVQTQQEVAKTNQELNEQMKDLVQLTISVIEDRQIVDGVDKDTGEVIPN